MFLGNKRFFSESICDFRNKNYESYSSSRNGIIVFHANAFILRDIIENSISRPERNYEIAYEKINVTEHFATDFQEFKARTAERIDKIIQFHWSLDTTNSRFWLVNMLLRKFHTLSKKETKMIKTQILWWKTAKNCLKSIRKH